MSYAPRWWGMHDRRARRVVSVLSLALMTSALVTLPTPGLSTPTAAAAPSFVVASTADAPDANPGDGTCATSDANGAVCTLRAAVQEANATLPAAGTPSIAVPAGTYLLGSPLTVTRSVTVTGAAAPEGPDATILDGQGTIGVLDVTAGTVTLSGLVVRNGFTRQDGAGLRVAAGATVTVLDSTFRANAANQGGGISNNGTMTIRRSTVTANSASQKGGGISSDGTVTIVNSTLSGNTSKQGGGISAAGTAYVSFSTIVGNSSTNKPGGGFLRNGGTVQIKNSIIGDNTANGVDGKDCSGSPDLLGLNLVSTLSGCNPVGPVLVGPPGLGALADNGGPTQTHAVLPGSQAFDAVVPANCTDLAGTPVVTDQRGVARPNGSGCELGSYEVAPLSITVDLSTDATQVGIGAQFVPVENILSAIRSTRPADEPVGSTPLASIPLASIPLASIDPVANPLASIPLASIPLASIYTAAAPLASIPLASIPLASIVLSELTLTLPGGFEALLAGTPFEGIPLQTLTLSDIQTVVDDAGVTFADVSFGSTPLASIPLASILFAGTPLASIALDATLLAGTDIDRVTAWCELLGGTVCADLGIDPSTGDDAGLTLLSLSLARIPLASIPLASIPLASIDADPQVSPLASIPLASIDWFSTPLASIPLASIDAAVLATVCTSTPSFDCATATLGEAAAAGALTGLVGDLLAALAGDPLLADYTVADLLFGILTPGEVPWEEIDVQSVPLQAAADPKEPAFRYLVDFTVDGGPGEVTVTLTLPDRFAYAADLADRALLDGGTAPDPTVSGDVLTFTLSDVASGDHTLAVAVRAWIDLGLFTASVTADVSSGTETSSAGPATTTVEVIDAGEGSSPASDVRLLEDGRLVVNLAHISGAEDVDVFTFTIPDDGISRSARILMSNLPADYDLTLFGPPLADPLRGTPSREFTVLDDIVFGLTPGDETLTTDTLEDIPLNTLAEFGIDSTAVLNSISATRGTNDEEIDTGTLRPGVYYVQVSSYNGVFTDEPYLLRAKFPEAGVLPACSPGADYTGLTAGVSSLPAGLNTLFITNKQWLVGTYGAGATAIIDRLEGNAGLGIPGVGSSAWSDLGVIGGVLYVDGDSVVRQAYTDRAADRCNPAASNDIVREIGRLIDGVVASHPELQNIVIVGDDNIIPMARIPDGVAVSNESTHLKGYSGNNELVGALRNGYYLTDDPYGSDAGIAVNDHEMFVPKWPTGRLVEYPADIATALANFVAFDGRLDPSTGSYESLVTGYDFLTDGAQAVEGELAAGGASDADPGDALISEQWTRAQLIAALNDSNLDAVSINAHFDETRSLPAYGNTTQTETELFTTDDLDSAVTLLDRLVIFSMGCHSGLSVSDVQVGSAIPDWAERFGARDVVYAANTGYGYGETVLVALSEQLNVDFASRLDTHTVGEAWMLAKQQYAGELVVLSPYDEKVSQEFVLYGLPMYVVGRDPAPAAPAAPVAAPTVVPEAATPGTDPISGLPAVQTGFRFGVSLTPGGSAPDVLQLVQTPEGAYYEVDGNTIKERARPLQPLAIADITQPDGSGGLAKEAAGVLVTGLVSESLSGFAPLYYNPQRDLSAHEPRTEAGDATFPAEIASVSIPYSGDDGQVRQNLLLAAGRFRSEGTAGTGTQQLFTSVDASVFYKDAGDPTVVPLIRRSVGRIGDGVVHFEVVAQDAVRVVAAFIPDDPSTAASPTAWLFAELFNVPGTDTWVGGRPQPGAYDNYRFFVQAVGPYGETALSDGKGLDFNTTDPSPFEAVTVNLLPLAPPTPGDNGWYLGDVLATAESDVPIASFSLDGGPLQPYPSEGVTITGDGGHILRVLDENGGFGFAFVAIDSTQPTAAASADPAPVAGWNGTAVTVALSATDPIPAGTSISPSGVASITYSATGAETIAETTVSGDAATIIVAAEGVTTVSFFATDAAGNESEIGTLTLSIDSTGPTVLATPSPAPNAAGWNNTSVDVTVTATDAGSGVASASCSTTGAQVTTNSGPAPTTCTVTNEGTTTVAYSATDTAGNTTTGSPDVVVKIDKTKPSVTLVRTPATSTSGWNKESVTVTPTATDALSGIAGVTLSVNGGTPAAFTGTSYTVSAEGVTTLSFVATDAAGNVGDPATITIRIDQTGPVVSCGAADGLWHATDVSIGCTAADLGVGLGNSGDASFSLSTSVPAGSAEANALTGTRTVCDALGNCTTAGPIAGNKVDKAKPTATVTAPINGATYTIGQVVNAAYACTDVGSGVASCTGPVANGAPLNTSTAGTFTFQVTATDNVGNTSSATVTYTVKYNICLLYDPTQPNNPGSTVPIKLQLCNAAGVNLSSRSHTLTAIFIDGTLNPPPNDAGGANQGFIFRYDSKLNGYIYNFKSPITLGPGVHTLDFTVDGAGFYSAPFTIR